MLGSSPAMTFVGERPTLLSKNVSFPIAPVLSVPIRSETDVATYLSGNSRWNEYLYFVGALPMFRSRVPSNEYVLMRDRSPMSLAAFDSSSTAGRSLDGVPSFGLLASTIFPGVPD